LQGHKELAPDIVFDFEGDIGEVAVVGWAQVLAALKTLVRPCLLDGKDITAKLKWL
jgi:hypothetical protein